MKALLNWRYYVMFALFVVGLLALTRAFGEQPTAQSDLEWFKQFALSFSVSAGCFYTLGRLTKRWEARGEIPQLTKLNNIE